MLCSLEALRWGRADLHTLVPDGDAACAPSSTGGDCAGPPTRDRVAVPGQSAYLTFIGALIDPPAWLLDLYLSGRRRGISELYALRKLHESQAAPLFKLNQAFHLCYHSAPHLGMWRGPYKTASEFIEATWLPFLQMYAHEIAPPHPELAAYLLGQGLRSVIRSLLEDSPAKLESVAMLDCLVAMALGCLHPMAAQERRAAH